MKSAAPAQIKDTHTHTKGGRKERRCEDQRVRGEVMKISQKKGDEVEAKWANPRSDGVRLPAEADGTLHRQE